LAEAASTVDCPSDRLEGDNADPWMPPHHLFETD
jgi:hypothetical protein